MKPTRHFGGGCRYPLPPLPTGLTSTSSTVPTGPPENENENISQQNEGVGQGSKADVDEASVRSRLQVLTKDELKEVMKANNVISSNINRRSKDGKLLLFSLSTL